MLCANGVGTVSTNTSDFIYDVGTNDASGRTHMVNMHLMARQNDGGGGCVACGMILATDGLCCKQSDYTEN